MNRRGIVATALLSTGLLMPMNLPQPARASDTRATTVDAKVLAYGQHLARECTGCHRIDGVDNGIPSITGGDSTNFALTLKYYQDGQRNNPAMVSVAQSLDEAQIAALAAYYGTLPKMPGTKK